MTWICAKNKYSYLGMCDTFLNEEVKLGCRIVSAWKSDPTNDLAIPIAKGSPYRDIMDDM